MSESHTAQLRELDAFTDKRADDPALAGELFSLVEIVEREHALRRALTDPSLPAQAREQLVTGLFGGKVGEAAMQILIAASGERWGAGESLATAVERQGIRAVLTEALRAGRLDQVESELFAVLRLVDANPELGAALNDRRRDLADREALIDGLLADKVAPETKRLAVRAVAARRRNFDLTLERYLSLAADLRHRDVAEVRVARPLTEEQHARLKAALIAQAGRDLTLQVAVDPEVLGGVQVKIGSDIIEGTVAGRLEAARRAFSS